MPSSDRLKNIGVDIYIRVFVIIDDFRSKDSVFKSQIKPNQI